MTFQAWVYGGGGGAVPYLGFHFGGGGGGGGGFKIFFEKWRYLHGVKPRVYLGGSGVWSPETIFLKWCILENILLKFCKKKVVKIFIFIKK